MKKRLSLLMALMMVLSLVPMSAFAANLAVTTDDVVNVNVEFDLGSSVSVTSDKVVFFELTNGAVVTKTPIVDQAAGAVDYNSSNDAYFSVALADGTDTVNVKMEVDFSDCELGDVQLVGDFSQLKLGTQKETFATVEKAASTTRNVVVTKESTKIGENGGKLSPIEIRNAGSKVTSVELVAPEGFTFVDGTTVTDYGFGTKTAVAGTNSDKLSTLTISGLTDSTRLALTPEISTVSSKADFGSVVVTVNYLDSLGKLVDDQDVTMGEFSDYEVAMKVVEEDETTIPSLYAGKDSKTVEVTLSGVAGSLGLRPIDIVVDGIDVVYDTIDVTSTGVNDATKGNVVNDDGFVEDGEFTITPRDAKATKIVFTMEVKSADWDVDGTATLNASTREFDLTQDLAVVKPIFTATSKVIEVRKGEATPTSNIVITETAKGMIGTSEKLAIQVNAKKGVEFADDELTVEGTNGMTFGDSKFEVVNTNDVKEESITIPVKKSTTKEGSVVTISDIILAVDGNTVDSDVKIDILYGKNVVATVDYAKVVKEYSTTTSTTVFTIGSKDYTVNGTAMTAVAAPYVQEGRTMLPIRAVAESLGLKVDYNTVTKQITFTNDSKVATLVVGADTMYVNGSPVKLSVPSTLKSDTTFVELRSVATAFGVGIEWDAATKTVTING